MFLLGKLLGLLAVQRTFTDSKIFHQLLARVAMLIVLTVVAAFMIGALLVGIFYLIHLGLISYGLTPDAACVVVVVLALLLTAILILALYLQVQKLQTTLRRALQAQSPVASRLTEVANAFADGLMGTPPHRKE